MAVFPSLLLNLSTYQYNKYELNIVFSFRVIMQS